MATEDRNLSVLLLNLSRAGLHYLKIILAIILDVLNVHTVRLEFSSRAKVVLSHLFSHSDGLVFLVELPAGLAVAAEVVRVDVMTVNETSFSRQCLSDRDNVRDAKCFEHPAVDGMATLNNSWRVSDNYGRGQSKTVCLTDFQDIDDLRS